MSVRHVPAYAILLPLYSAMLVGLVLTGSGCASTQQERSDAFHRFVQPDAHTRIVVDTQAKPFMRCYAVSGSHARHDFVVIHEVDCKTHHDVLELP